MKQTVFTIAIIALLLLPRISVAQGADTLKFERRIYETDYYRAVVSGYQPRLDTLEIYIGSKVINNYLIRVETRKEKRMLRKMKRNKNL
jgi:hypothetical protein